MSFSAKKSAFSLTIKDYPKLTGKADYLTWAKSWQWAFKSARLWPIVSGEKTKPEVREEGKSSDSTVKTATEWEEENTQAMFLLIQGVSSTLQPDIVSYETAAEAWQAMKDRFDKETIPPDTPSEIPGTFPTEEPTRRTSPQVKLTDKAVEQLQLEKEKIRRSIQNIYKKMSKEADTFAKDMTEMTDSNQIEDRKQQHVLRRQFQQEKISNLQARIDKKEFAGLMYHIPDPNSYREAMESDEVEEWKKAMD